MLFKAAAGSVALAVADVGVGATEPMALPSPVGFTVEDGGEVAVESELAAAVVVLLLLQAAKVVPAATTAAP